MASAPYLCNVTTVNLTSLDMRAPSLMSVIWAVWAAFLLRSWNFGEICQENWRGIAGHLWHILKLKVIIFYAVWFRLFCIICSWKCILKTIVPLRYVAILSSSGWSCLASFPHRSRSVAQVMKIDYDMSSVTFCKTLCLHNDCV